MNRNDIIRMAREAGLPYMYQTGEIVNLGLVERFAAIVAAAEQKKWQDQTEIEIHEAVLDEREACAKVCEQDEFQIYETAGRCAAAIRVRGQA